MNYINSEYNKIKEILLYCPNSKINNISNLENALHINKIDHKKIKEEYENIIHVFKDFNINVNLIDDTKIKGTTDDYLLNMMYCRDLFFMTPKGAILSEMAYNIRKDEVIYVERALKKNNINIIHKVDKNSKFEGADALWINKELVIVGVGNRTDNNAYLQLKKILNEQNIKCIKVPVYKKVTQHLLGTLQIVDKDLAFVREAIIENEIIELLRNNGFKVICIAENNEIKTKQSMNIVTIEPSKIIMTANCPETKEIYEKNGVEILAELQIDNLINGAGGLACATNIISREFLS